MSPICPSPVAAVDGYALGGDTEMALACDLRIATPDAKVIINVLPAGGGTQRLVQTVGVGIAKELSLTGQFVDAAGAEDIELANHVYPPAELKAEVESMVKQLASKAPFARRFAEESINCGLNSESSLDFERRAGAFLFSTEDKQEGVKTFLEDRDPEYEGR